MRTQRQRASARLARLEAIARWTRWAEREQQRHHAPPALVLERYLEAVNAELKTADGLHLTEDPAIGAYSTAGINPSHNAAPHTHNSPDHTPGHPG